MIMESKKEKVLLFGDSELVVGVVSGIANYLNMSTKKVRIVYRALTILTGIIPGIIAYIIIAFIMVLNEERHCRVLRDAK